MRHQLREPESGPPEAARRARFGKLPERIRLEDTTEGYATTAPDPARDTYNSDEWLVRTCL